MNKKKVVEFTYMSPAKLQELSLDLWGEKWRDRLCEFFDLTYSQLHRYMTVYKGQTIPKRIAVCIEMLGILKANEIPFPTGEEHKIPVNEAQAVKFIAVARPKVPRAINDAPEIDLFGEDAEEQQETVEQAPEQQLETAPEQPEQDKSETGAGQEKKRTRAKKEPVSKPAAKAKRAPAKKKAA